MAPNWPEIPVESWATYGYVAEELAWAACGDVKYTYDFGVLGDAGPTGVPILQRSPSAPETDAGPLLYTNPFDYVEGQDFMDSSPLTIIMETELVNWPGFGNS